MAQFQEPVLIPRELAEKLHMNLFELSLLQRNEIVKGGGNRETQLNRYDELTVMIQQMNTLLHKV